MTHNQQHTNKGKMARMVKMMRSDMRQIMTQATTKMMKMMKSRKKSVLRITVILVLKLPRVHGIAPIARLMIKGLSSQKQTAQKPCPLTMYVQAPFFT